MDRTHLFFTPVGQSKAFLEIAQQIREHIENGTLKIGSRLPSERELAEMFRTSRPTVREALRALEILDIIESKVGQGTFVKTANFSGVNGVLLEISNQTSPSDVFDARFAIEPYQTYLAALHATQENLMSLKHCLDQTEEAIKSKNIKRFEELDGAFHHEIALAAKNSLLLRVTDIINSVRSEKFWGTLKERSLSEERMRLYAQEHLRIYEAIKERDVRKAKHSSLNHLKNVRSNMLGY
ncbi:FadR/GntR family transcriptional regulator [Effusibacillus dendaii]|uniref:GntR family transcriptional regulator n=1 Tax=Effusibacillus dendaii TaxID=2743772 RepID=A0A7I8DEQ0_9BACL|nr:FadR/GntR family transcriptional regulator [Effusibacillus dendaii]BCJ88535.1 GntR family transcriptional regulator [Effusibacillus dendaii]